MSRHACKRRGIPSHAVGKAKAVKTMFFFIKNRFFSGFSGLALILVLANCSPGAQKPQGAESGAKTATQQSAPAPAPRTPPGGRFILRSHTGKVLTDQDFLGQYLLIDFGYTTCPDVCPTTLLKLAQVDKLLGDDAKNLQVLFISVDPDRDTPEVLRRYVTSFDPAFVGLTGSKAAIDSVTKKYHVKYDYVGKDSPGDMDYSVDHTSAVFFMGPDGRFIARFSYPTPAKQIADQVRAAMHAAPAPQP